MVQNGIAKVFCTKTKTRKRNIKLDLFKELVILQELTGYINITLSAGSVNF